MGSVTLSTFQRLEVWLRGPGHREVLIARRNIPGYGQMIPGFRVSLFDLTRPTRKKTETWMRRAEATTVREAVAEALDKARARKMRTVHR